jgi:hypothetical protein
MHRHPKNFWVYISPFLMVVPFTLAFFLIARGVVETHSESAMNKLTQALWTGLNADLDHLENEGDAVAALPSLHEHIRAQDYEAILALMLAERQARNIGLMGLTDSEGYIITRTKTINALGDNVFTTRPQGRALAAGAPSVRTIEGGGVMFPDQIVMTTGRFVIADGEKLGALFSNYLLDDTYALKMSNVYLAPISQQSEIAFYNKAEGIYGSSFADHATKETVDAYFRLDNLPAPGQAVTLTVDGQDYRVKNVELHGLEDNDAGALLFVPTTSPARLVLYAFVCAIILAFLGDFIISRQPRD